MIVVVIIIIILIIIIHINLKKLMKSATNQSAAERGWSKLMWRAAPVSLYSALAIAIIIFVIVISLCHFMSSSWWLQSSLSIEYNHDHFWLNVHDNIIWHLPLLCQFDVITYTPRFQKPNCWSAQLRWTWYCFQQFVKDKSFLWFIEVVFGDWYGYRQRLPKLCPTQPFAVLSVQSTPHMFTISKRSPSPPPYFKQRWHLPSTLLCNISLLSGLWNIAQGGDPL